MFLVIDRFLLERVFEPFAHWFERTTGHTNFYLAWWVSGFALFSLIAELGLQITQTHDLTIVDMVLGPILLVTLCGLMIMVRNEDEKLHKRPWLESSVGARERAEFWYRILLFFSSVFELVKLSSLVQGFVDLVSPAVLVQFFWTLQLTCVCLASYLLCVRRPPPDWEKKEEFAPVSIHS